RGLVAGAAAPGLVGKVDRIARAQEILRPAFAAVRRAGEVGGGLRRAWDDHDRIGLRAPARDLVLDIHLAAQHLAAVDRDVFAAGEQIALLGDGEALLRLRAVRRYKRERRGSGEQC